MAGSRGLTGSPEVPVAGLVLQIALSGGLRLLQTLPAVLLMALKDVADLLLHRRQHRRAAAADSVRAA